MIASNILQRLAQRGPSQARSLAHGADGQGDAAVTVEWRAGMRSRVSGPRVLEGLACSPETTSGPSRAVCSQGPS